MTAPPTIPVARMPVKEPWYSETELSASEIRMGHMTDANRPTSGKAIAETLPGANSARERKQSAPIEAPINILRLSNILSSSTPARHPEVISPQNHATAFAPVV